MADLSLVIHTDPPLALYRGSRPQVDRAFPRLVDVGELSSMLRIDGGETPHVSVTGDNGDGAMTPLFASAPLLEEASLYQGSSEIWRGVIARVSCGARIQLELEA